ncbi:toprim domain-containing protein [bacterium]|nr:toprim domain-containing protein [bacterium]
MTDYKSVLENLGYRLKDHGSYWRTSAVYRSGDNSTALQVYKDTGVWKDYVEDSMFLPFEALLKKTLNTNDSSVLSSYLKNDSVNIYERTTKKHLLSEEKTYPDSCLNRLLPHYDFYLNRGISVDTLEKFRCGLAMSGKMYQRVIFPIVRSDGKIHGFSGRKVTDDPRPKWLHNGRCSDWFYPYYSIDEVSSAIEEHKCVYVVESVGDCISLFESGIKNVLVSFGLNISPKFISKLNGLPLDKIFIAFNNDFNSQSNRGFQGSIKSIFKLCDQIDFTKIFFSPPPENDFGDMSKDQINNYVECCSSMQHNESMSNVIDFAKDMNKKGINQTFSNNLKKLEKKFDFHYGEI